MTGPWPAAARLPTVLAGTVLLTAACGGGGSQAGPGTSSSAPGTYQQFVAYSQCMRAHGDPTFPDPQQGPGGAWAFPANPQDQSAFSGPGYNAAQSACKKLNPPSDITPAVRQAAVDQLLKLARCMRAHGITNFPDPDTRGGGVSISLQGIDPDSPQFQAAQRACQQYAPHFNGGGT